MTTSQRRLTFTLGGLALIFAGVVFWLVGDQNSVSGDNGMDIHSSAAWGKVLDYQSTEEKDYDDAKVLKEKGEGQKNIGLAFIAVGAIVFALRFVARPSAKGA